VGRVVGGIDVEDKLRRCLPTGADEEVHQVAVEDLQALGLGGPHFEQHGAFFGGEFGVAAREGVGEARQGTARGEGLGGIRTDVGEDLEEGVDAQLVGVVVVGVAGEQGVDLLSEERFDGVTDEFGGAWVRQLRGEVGDDAERAFQGADGEESGVGDDAAALEIDEELLRAEVPQGKVVNAFGSHELEPPQMVKCLTSQHLTTVEGSSHKSSVRNPG